MICVDASVVAKWLFKEEFSEQARALYREAQATFERVIAPVLLPFEVNNVIRQRMRRPKPPGNVLLTRAEAHLQLERFLHFGVELNEQPGLHQRALDLADAHRLPAVYDAYYVALAQVLECELWTADRAMLDAVASELHFVRWIGEYQLPTG